MDDGGKGFFDGANGLKDLDAQSGGIVGYEVNDSSLFSGPFGFVGEVARKHVALGEALSHGPAEVFGHDQFSGGMVDVIQAPASLVIPEGLAFDKGVVGGYGSVIEGQDKQGGAVGWAPAGGELLVESAGVWLEEEALFSGPALGMELQ